MASNEWRSLASSEQQVADNLSSQPWGSHAPSTLQRMLIHLCKTTVLGRGVFRRPMTLMIKRLGSGTLDVVFRGCRYRLYDDENLIEDGILVRKDYNHEELDFLLEGSPPEAHFLDIGSNIGLYALPMAKSCPSGMVLAIDANQKMARRLAWNADANGFHHLVIEAVAVGKQEGLCDLEIRGGDQAIVAVKEKPGGAIPVKPLTALVAHHGITRIWGLKIDIEGHEDDALVPFFNDVPKTLWPKRIVIEHLKGGEDYPGCAAAFERCGYRRVGQTRNNSMFALDSPVY